MSHLETELSKLKNSVLEMMKLVNQQLEKSKDAYIHSDKELAEEIIHNERRVNALEISIDRDCEVIFALQTPVATNLRFVIAMLKINSDLERIGDYADGIADYVVDSNNGKINPELIKAVRLSEMFDTAISMTHDIRVAFEKKDTKMARKVYKKDQELNLINSEAVKVIAEHVKKTPEDIRQALFLFSTIRKLERVGDHVKNVAEDIIFYLEAEVLKHKKI